MRKLSLNWFRSLSYSPTEASQQGGTNTSEREYARMRHYSTIPEDRRSEISKVAKEVTWVVASHTATPNSDELSVNSGDQVHLVEKTEKRPGWSYVRRIADDAEGWVPNSCLRSPPASYASSPNIAEIIQK
ncbi:hypothetical protein X975_04170, partial [Stegodyphus mimosarum]